MRKLLATGVIFLALMAALSPAMVAESPAKGGFLADKHLNSGLTCESCHGKGQPGDVPMEKCLSCHGSYQELAKKTSGRAYNPHDSHFPNLECTTCHHGHRESENFCSTCHNQ